MESKVYSVDVDGTLCHETCWNEEDVRRSTPNKDVIKRVNRLYSSNFIVIHTARRHELYLPTIKWLSTNGVSYHAVCFEKMPSNHMIDLDSINKIDDI